MARIAIVGGGPKAVAIAAKAYALKSMAYTTPEIVIYERDFIGAAWSGQRGYTDGLQSLCTPAERDLGYPYDRASYGADAARFMFQRFSWHAFSVSHGLGAAEYDDWVLHGRSPPAHRVFAAYLDSAAKLIFDSPTKPVGTQIKRGTVVELDFDDRLRQWCITWTDANSAPQKDHHDGVVITGSGESVRALPGANGRVFDGESFWRELTNIAALLQNDLDPEVAIIGAGGTAAAIAYWFIRAGMRAIPITIIGREATLFARHMAPFEDRLFTDSAAWNRLTDHAREAFAARVIRGVVSDNVLRGLEADNVSYESYVVSGFVASNIPNPAAAGAPAIPALPPALDAVLEDPSDPAVTIIDRFCQQHGYPPPPRPLAQAPRHLPATVFVDARGFTPWWFVDKVPPQSALRGHFADLPSILASIDFTLAVGPQLRTGQFPSGLHVPMLASRQGPAASNLMALGWMSDRVLRNYVTPPRSRRGGGTWNHLTD